MSLLKGINEICNQNISKTETARSFKLAQLIVDNESIQFMKDNSVAINAQHVFPLWQYMPIKTYMFRAACFTTILIFLSVLCISLVLSCKIYFISIDDSTQM